MKFDAPLPPVFRDGNICLLEAWAFKEEIPRRASGRVSGFETGATRATPMKARALRVLIDGGMYAFVEDGSDVSYVPDGLRAPRKPMIAPPRVTVTMTGSVPVNAAPSPTQSLSPPTKLTGMELPRVVSMRRVRNKEDMTLLWIDEGGGATIAVIGARIHWDLEGIDVRFEITDRKELRP